MCSINKRKIQFSLSLMLGFLISGQGMAAVMTFDNGLNVGANFSNSGSMAPSIFPDLNNVRVYRENGLEHTAVSFNNGSPNSHVHGAGGNLSIGNTTVVAELAADAGGAVFRASNPGQRFSLNSWDFDSLGLQLIDTSQTPFVFAGETTLEVRGFLSGSQVASASFDSSFAPSNQLVTVDFLNLDSGFANVDQVEYWFAEFGRGEIPDDSAVFVKVHIDNVHFDLVAVPVPAALYLFASGILLLLPKGLRRK